MRKLYVILLLLAVVFCSGCEKERFEADLLQEQIYGTWDYDYCMNRRYEQATGKLMSTSGHVPGQIRSRMNFYADGITCKIFYSETGFSEQYRIEDGNLYVGKELYGRIAIDGNDMMLKTETSNKGSSLYPDYIDRTEIHYRRWK